MSNLIASLLNNADSMGVHSYAAEVAGKNMANVNNPNYARQRVNISSVSVAEGGRLPQPMGIAADSVSHARSALLDGQVVREKMLTAALSEEQKFGQSVETALGEGLSRTQDSSALEEGTAAAGNGISAALDDMFAALHSVASTPTDDSQKQVLLDKTNILTTQLNEVDRRLQVIDSDIATQIDEEVKQVNTLLDEIAGINLQINRLEVGNNGSALDLRDQRQRALEDLSELVNYNTQMTSANGGDLRIYVYDNASNPIDLVNGRQRTGDIAYDGSSVFSVGGTAVQVTGGSLAGAQNARSGVLADLSANLDNVAAQLISELNTAYAGTYLSGADASDISLAAGIDVSTFTTTATANAGANELVLAMAELENDDTVGFTLQPGGTAWAGTFSGRMANIVAQVGSEVSDTVTRLDSQELVEKMITDQRDSLSAVSMDEEVAELLRYQRAFQGSARVMSTIDQMLEWIVTRL